MTAAVTVSTDNLIPQVAGPQASVTTYTDQLIPQAATQFPSQHTRTNNLIPLAFGRQATTVTYTDQLIPQALVRGRPKQRTLRVWTMNLDGHSFYGLHLEDYGTIVYDQTTGNWSEWQSNIPTAGGTIPYAFRGRCARNWDEEVVMGDDASGMIWNVIQNTYSDEDPVATNPNYQVTAILTGGVPMHARTAASCNGVMISYSAGYPNDTSATVNLQTSDDQGNSYQDQGTVTLTEDTSGQVQWLSLGRMAQPLRIFKFTDNGVPRIDNADMW